MATEHDEGQPPTRPGLRTMAFALVLASCSIGVLSGSGVTRLDSVHGLLSWWHIAAIAIASELLVFHVEFRRETYSFSLSEIPLVLGAFLAAPLHFIVGRLLGELIVLTVKERQPPRKILLNLSTFLAECAVLLIVFRSVAGSVAANEPTAWGAAFLAVMAADAVGFLAVSLVIRWHGVTVSLRSILTTGAITATVNTSLGLTIAVLLVTEPWATVLLLGIGAFVFISYRSYAALSQRHESLSLLYDFTRLVSGSKRPDTVLEAILVQAKDLMRADHAVIWLTQADRGIVALIVDDRGRRDAEVPADAESLMNSWLVPGIESIVVPRGAEPTQRAIATAVGADDCIVAPITEAGEIIGLIAVAGRLGEVATFVAADGQLFGTLAHHASVALENGRLIERLHTEAGQREYEAHHDALTGLPNRLLFGERLRERVGRLADSDSPFAVLVMDLDGFKDINDTLGHHAGDEVLIEVGRRITRATGSEAVAARLGGDEFALLVESGSGPAEVAAIARRVKEALAAPLYLEGLRFEVGVSIGIALAPTDGSDGATLLQRADISMYEAKAGHGGGIEFFHPDRNTNNPRRLTLTNDLRSAIGAGELTLYYQPKARLADGQVVGAEALVRWRHPDLGLVPPDEFIPIAERTGVITELTAFVLEQGLYQLREWNRVGLDWGVSINLSMRSLIDAGLAPGIAALLTSTGVRPERVTLEITETSVMSDATRSIKVLGELAALGVRLSIDDFGTGYSSLAYLQRLPVDEIKIDKSFVQPMVADDGARAIVRSVLDLAGRLGLSVVAEGVEDRATWDLLRSFGCGQIQGYYLARPMPASDIAHWLEQGPGGEAWRLSA